jgi:hypothetical protein
MKNVTVTLDEDTAAWVRLHAAGQGMSVSRYLGELLQRQMRSGGEYEEAMRRFLAKRPAIIKAADDRYPTREETYDRPGLRR